MTRRADQITWTAREAFAVAYCWSEFHCPEQNLKETPESYWLSISERSRNECRRVANDMLFLAVARGQAVSMLPWHGLREGERQRLLTELGMKSESRLYKILHAVQKVFKCDVRKSARAESDTADAA